MRSFRVGSVVIWLAVAGFVAACGDSGGNAGTVEGPGGKTDQLTGGDGRLWTVMVYGAFDSKDEGGIDSSLQEMSQKIKVDTDKVAFLYLEDLKGDGNTRIWKVGKGTVTLEKDLGERHTGMPETLTDYLVYVKNKYPAKQYALDLIGHSRSGLKGMMSDYAMGSDSAMPGENMSYQEIVQAIQAAGMRMSVLTFAACGSGALEVAYQARTVADFAVGVQEYAMGYVDVRWAGSLAEKPEISPSSLAARIADGMFKRGSWTGDLQATGAWELAYAQPAMEDLQALIDAMTKAMPAHSVEIAQARCDAQDMVGVDGIDFAALVDLVDFVTRIEQGVTDEAVVDAAGKLLDTLSKFIVAYYQDNEAHANAHGLSILFFTPYSPYLCEAKALGSLSSPSNLTDVAYFDLYNVTTWPTFVSSMYQFMATWDGVVPDPEEPDPEEPPATGPCSGSGKPGFIGVEVDYIGYQRMIPQANQILKSYFEGLGYTFELVEDETLEPIDYAPYGSENAKVKEYYQAHFQHRGQAGWHYLLMADKVENSNRGWGMMCGDMAIVSADYQTDHPNHLAEGQANIILHELGHNFCLVHEGCGDSSRVHDNTTCAMAMGVADPPSVWYDEDCAAHVNLQSVPLVP